MRPPLDWHWNWQQVAAAGGGREFPSSTRVVFRFLHRARLLCLSADKSDNFESLHSCCRRSSPLLSHCRCKAAAAAAAAAELAKATWASRLTNRQELSWQPGSQAWIIPKLFPSSQAKAHAQSQLASRPIKGLQKRDKQTREREREEGEGKEESCEFLVFLVCALARLGAPSATCRPPNLGQLFFACAQSVCFETLRLERYRSELPANLLWLTGKGELEKITESPIIDAACNLLSQHAIP